MEQTELCAALGRTSGDNRRRLLNELPPSQDPALLDCVAAYLGDPVAAVCEAAINALVRAGNGAAAQAAACRLLADEPAERGYALETLIRLGVWALPTLLNLLHDQDRDLRKYAVDALASLAEPATLPALITALQDEDVNVAAAAAEALGRLGLPDAVPALAAAIERDSNWLRVAALTSLGVIGGGDALVAICRVPQDHSEPWVLATAASAAARACQGIEIGQAVAFLIRLLRHESLALAETALLALGDLGACNLTLPADERKLLAATALHGIRSDRPEVRAAAAYLVMVSDKADAEAAVQLLLPLSQADPEPAVRLAALIALDRLRHVNPLDLASLAGNRSEALSLRLGAVRLLAETDQDFEETVGPLLELISTEEEPPALRLASLRVLIQRKRLVPIEAVLPLLVTPELLDDETALAELQRLPLEDLDGIGLAGLAQQSAPSRRQIMQVVLAAAPATRLHQMSDGQRFLTIAAGDEDGLVRSYAIRILEGCQANWAGALIRAACHDPDLRVRVQAVKALGSQPLTTPDRDLLHDLLHDDGGWVRAAVYRILLQPAQQSEVALRQVLADPFPPARRAGLVTALQLSPPCGCSSESLARAALAALALDGEEDPELANLAHTLLEKLALCPN